MDENTRPLPGARRTALLKAVLFLLFIVAAVGLVRYSPLKQYLTAEALQAVLDKAGFWAPVVFIFVYAGGVCLFIPGTLLTGLGAAIFGEAPFGKKYLIRF